MTRRAAGNPELSAGRREAPVPARWQASNDLDVPLIVRGISVLGISDLFAMKVNAIGDRGELRDYFDLQQIELLTEDSSKKASACTRRAMESHPRTRASPTSFRAWLPRRRGRRPHAPRDKAQIEAYWHRRQPQVLRSLSRHGAGASALGALRATTPVPPRLHLNCYLSELPAPECACPCAESTTARGPEPTDRGQVGDPREFVQQWCYTAAMPTVHPRIALTRDPELDRALKVGASMLGPSKPTASVARELILRGANDLLANFGPELDRWLTERGATPATRSTGDLLASGGCPRPSRPPRPTAPLGRAA